jgi:hypothetical protein
MLSQVVALPETEPSSGVPCCPWFSLELARAREQTGTREVTELAGTEVLP